MQEKKPMNQNEYIACFVYNVIQLLIHLSETELCCLRSFLVCVLLYQCRIRKITITLLIIGNTAFFCGYGCDSNDIVTVEAINTIV